MPKPRRLSLDAHSLDVRIAWCQVPKPRCLSPAGVSFGGHPQDGHLCLGTPWSQVSSFNWFWDALWLVPGPRKTVLRFPGGPKSTHRPNRKNLLGCRGNAGTPRAQVGVFWGGLGVVSV